MKFTAEQIEYLEYVIEMKDLRIICVDDGIFGNVYGDVWGSVCGNVYGDVKRSVWGTVDGKEG